jgi:paraquat-inducible protein B
MASAQALLRQINTNAGPALARLPRISAELEASLDRANHLMAALESGYGANSPLPRDLERLVGEMNDAARSIRSLADLLDQHPEALVRGRSGPVEER